MGVHEGSSKETKACAILLVGSTYYVDGSDNIDDSIMAQAGKCIKVDTCACL
jgi:hypothetical protein